MTKLKSTELALESIEIILKQAIDDGVLKDIPIVGNIFKLMDIGGSIRDRIYGSKVAKFVTHLNQIADDDKFRLQNSILEKKEDVDKLTQKILLSLETQTDLEKSDIIANLFLAYLDDQITSSNFRRAVDLTNTAFLDDVMCFIYGGTFSLERYEHLESQSVSSLISSPLIGIDGTSQQELKLSGREELMGVTLYKSTDFGSIYREAYHYGNLLRKHCEKPIQECSQN